MIVILILLPLLLAGLCRYVHRRRTGMVLCILSGLLLLTSASGLIPSMLLTGLQHFYISDPVYHWTQNNAIIVLGGGTATLPDSTGAEPEIFAQGRIVKTVEVYLNCKKSGNRCTVIVSGGDPQQHGITEARAYSLSLEKTGVAAGDIVLEDKSRNTWQNAQFTAAVLKQNQLNGLAVLVTSGYHLQRSLMYFHHFGVHASPVRADFVAPKFNLSGTSYNLLLTDVALHEFLGIGRYHFYNLLGWNAPPVG